MAKRGLPSGRNRKPVFAYINHGRFVADCPCNGAELVSEGEDMVCGSCGTTSPVDFPDNTGEIERALLRRAPVFQNWLPGETVDELIAQNIENGLLPEDM